MRGFFFAPESVLPLARVRIALAVVLLWEAGWQWPFAIELWSTAGPALPVFLRSEIVPESQPDAEGRFPRRFVGWFHPPVPAPSLAILLASLRIFALTCVAVGWRTRTSLMLAAALALYLGLLDGTNFAKHSVLALHVLVLLAFSKCGAALAVEADPSARGRKTRFCPLHAAWPRRLIQLTVCHVYLGAALTKLRTPSFVTGELLTFSLLDEAWGGGMLGHEVARHPHLVVVLSLVTVFIELLFPFLVWVRKAKPWVLLLAVLMHAGMGLLLHVGVFPAVMLAVLLAFVDEGLWRQQWGSLPKGVPSAASCEDAPERVLADRSRWRNTLAYGVAALLALGAGWCLQWSRDDYGVFGRTVLPPPRRLTPAEVDERLWPATPAPDHYVLDIAIGSRLNGQQVFGEDRRFQVGQQIFVVVRFLRSHPALLVEGLLLSERGEEAARFTYRADVDRPAVTGGFELVAPLEAGPYLLVVQVDGHEVGRRRISVAAH